MASGPTQNYVGVGLDGWRPHPVVAAVVQVVLYLMPTVIAVGFGLAASHWLPASRLGISPWWWLVGEVAISASLLIVAHRAVAKAIPLTGLLKLAVVFPDRAPSRLAVATRTHSPAALARARECGEAGGPAADHLLDLVAALYAHDAQTRAHSERVQGYAVMIGQELGLSPADAARLSWAALLHDIGKLQVPAHVLAKKGRPDEQEWELLTAHPTAGAELAEPLAEWLGPWLDAVGQHHERWDGEGYPGRLAGEQISFAARIVAVADTYDVITSARSYKDAMPAAQARAELARCAGSQFDPRVVRAFLAIGLGRLRATAGPLSLLSGLPGLRSIPADLGAIAPAVGHALTGAAATVGALALTLTFGLGPSAAETTSAANTASGVQSSAGVPGAPHTTTPTGGPTPASSPSTGESPTAEPGDPTPTSAPATETTSATPTAAPPASTPAAPAPTTPPPAPPQTSCEKAAAGVVALAGLTLSGCALSGVDLSGADLTGAILAGVDLSGAKLDGARFTGATITSTSFANAKLTGATFAGATITDATFAGARTNSSTLDGATLVNCTQ